MVKQKRDSGSMRAPACLSRGATGDAGERHQRRETPMGCTYATCRVVWRFELSSWVGGCLGAPGWRLPWSIGLVHWRWRCGAPAGLTTARQCFGHSCCGDGRPPRAPKHARLAARGEKYPPPCHCGQRIRTVLHARQQRRQKLRDAAACSYPCKRGCPCKQRDDGTQC